MPPSCILIAVAVCPSAVRLVKHHPVPPVLPSIGVLRSVLPPLLQFFNTSKSWTATQPLGIFLVSPVFTQLADALTEVDMNATIINKNILHLVVSLLAVLLVLKLN